MPTVTADLIVRHDLFAKANVSGYDATLKNVKVAFTSGQYIGNVYGWIVDGTGNLYWMVYLTPNDYNTFNPTYIKQDSSALSVPDLPDILQKIEDEKKAALIAKDGVIGYYLQKYLPVIVGAVVVAIAFPAVYKNIRK